VPFTVIVASLVCSFAFFVLTFIFGYRVTVTFGLRFTSFSRFFVLSVVFAVPYVWLVLITLRLLLIRSLVVAVRFHGSSYSAVTFAVHVLVHHARFVRAFTVCFICGLRSLRLRLLVVRLVWVVTFVYYGCSFPLFVIPHGLGLFTFGLFVSFRLISLRLRCVYGCRTLPFILLVWFRSGFCSLPTCCSFTRCVLRLFATLRYVCCGYRSPRYVCVTLRLRVVGCAFPLLLRFFVTSCTRLCLPFALPFGCRLFFHLDVRCGSFAVTRWLRLVIRCYVFTLRWLFGWVLVVLRLRGWLRLRYAGLRTTGFYWFRLPGSFTLRVSRCAVTVRCVAARFLFLRFSVYVCYVAGYGYIATRCVCTFVYGWTFAVLLMRLVYGCLPGLLRDWLRLRILVYTTRFYDFYPRLGSRSHYVYTLFCLRTGMRFVLVCRSYVYTCHAFIRCGRLHVRFGGLPVCRCGAFVTGS